MNNEVLFVSIRYVVERAKRGRDVVGHKKTGKKLVPFPFGYYMQGLNLLFYFLGGFCCSAAPCEKL
jgi:hypothetical protein